MVCAGDFSRYRQLKLLSFTAPSARRECFGRRLLGIYKLCNFYDNLDMRDDLRRKNEKNIEKGFGILRYL